jgi:hypothetical protein
LSNIDIRNYKYQNLYEIEKIVQQIEINESNKTVKDFDTFKNNTFEDIFTPNKNSIVSPNKNNVNLLINNPFQKSETDNLKINFNFSNSMNFPENNLQTQKQNNNQNSE